MIKIKLINYPRQQFPVTLNGSRYELIIKDCNGFMTIDIARNDTEIIKGHRLLPNTPIIPYNHLTDGNFVLSTQNEELPDWNKFEITQELFYLMGDELTGII